MTAMDITTRTGRRLLAAGIAGLSLVACAASMAEAPATASGQVLVAMAAAEPPISPSAPPRPPAPPRFDDALDEALAGMERALKDLESIDHAAIAEAMRGHEERMAEVEQALRELDSITLPDMEELNRTVEEALAEAREALEHAAEALAEAEERRREQPE